MIHSGYSNMIAPIYIVHQDGCDTQWIQLYDAIIMIGPIHQAAGCDTQWIWLYDAI